MTREARSPLKILPLEEQKPFRLGLLQLFQPTSKSNLSASKAMGEMVNNLILM